MALFIGECYRYEPRDNAWVAAPMLLPEYGKSYYTATEVKEDLQLLIGGLSEIIGGNDCKGCQVIQAQLFEASFSLHERVRAVRWRQP